MPPRTQTTLGPVEVARLLVEYRRRWLIPAVLLAAVAGLYSVVRTPSWQASQAMLVRDQAAGNTDGQGRFRHSDDMKTVQETILELVRSRSVLAGALEEVGPSAGSSASDAWPSDGAVADLRGAVELTPPKGAEFGKTEVFYLKVKSRSKDRALALTNALSKHLQTRMQEMRDAKAQSMIDEINRNVALAEADLAEATGRLTTIEREVGGDLAELRILHEASSGEGDLRRKTVEIENELRAARNAQRESEELLSLLVEAEKDHDQLLATPNRLLVSQPSLRRLKDGLVDAQLHTAQLRGSMSDVHPQVRAAVLSEEQVAKQVHQELATAVRGVQVDLRLTAGRVASLEGQLADSHQRLDRLARLRADYSNLVAETRHRTELVETARRDLSDARAAQAGARSASLISLIDTPDAGTGPTGPGRASILLAGLMGGLAVGFGIVFLSVPLPTAPVATAGPHGAATDEVDFFPTAVAATMAPSGLSLKDALRRTRREWAAGA